MAWVALSITVIVRAILIDHVDLVGHRVNGNGHRAGSCDHRE